MLPFLKTLMFAAPICAFLTVSQRVGAQPNLLPPNEQTTLPVTTAVTNGNITFSWPVFPGQWELFKQQPPFTGEWKPAAEDVYHTNAAMVSATLPAPAKPAFYRVRRTFVMRHVPPAMPPVPPAMTNRPTRPKLPARP